MADWTKKGWYRHRINSTGDPKFGKLVRLYGPKGYAVYFLALEYIYDDVLGNIEIEAMADILKMNKEEIVSILETAQESCNGLLVKNPDETWSSPKASVLIDADEGKRDEKREKNKEYHERIKKKLEEARLSSLKSTEENLSELLLISNEKEECKKKEYKNLDFKKGESKNRGMGEGFGPLPPKKEDVEAYMHSIGRNFDVSRFMDYYSSVGWKMNGEPIADVEALIRRWPEDNPKKQNDTSSFHDSIDIPTRSL